MFVRNALHSFPAMVIPSKPITTPSEETKKDEAKGSELGLLWQCGLSPDSFIHDDLIVQSITEKGLTDPNRLERISVPPFCVIIIS